MKTKAQNEILSEQYYEYPSIPDLFFVRTYYVFHQKNDDTWAYQIPEAERRQRALKCLEILNAWYNPLGIYFLAAEADGQSNLEEYGCYKIFTSYDQQSFQQNGGLNIVVGKDEAGLAPSVFVQTPFPSVVMYMEGQENGVPAAGTNAVVHAAAHCFGLVHTFHHLENGTPTCDETVAVCTPNTIPSCRCCGDFVCETPPLNFSGFIQANSDCTQSIDPPGISPALFTNIMAHTLPVSCYSEFAHEQVLRMRTYLKNSSLLQQILDEPITISGGSVNWAATQTVYGNIEVAAGATLTVNAPLFMGPGAFIIVRPGGTLIVNDLITAACEGLWAGIRVEGNPDAAQEPAYQGRVILNSPGTIEHAECGIGLHGVKPDNDDLYGGIVKAYGTVKNCRTGIEFKRYRHIAVQNGQLVQVPNAGIFSGCRFFIDDDYRGPAGQRPVMADLNGIIQFPVIGCIFQDNRSDCAGAGTRALGIEAEDAGFRVLSGTVFSKLDEAIHTSALFSPDGLGSFEVRNAVFLNCYSGISAAVSDPMIIRNNYFGIDRPAGCPEEQNTLLDGIEIKAYQPPLGMDIADNRFVSELGPADSETLVGVDLYGTGAVENIVRQNEFQGLSVGCRVFGNNGNSSGGVWFECNTFIDTAFASFQVVSGGSIRSLQGHYDQNAQAYLANGNSFSGNGAHRFIHDGTPVTYFHADQADQIPVFSGNGSFLLVAAAKNPKCTGDDDVCPPPCAAGVGTSAENDFYEKNSAWQAKRHRRFGKQGSELLDNELVALRASMDIATGQIIRYYAFDTAGVHTDSILAWMQRVQRFETDLKLARRYFFSGDMNRYNAEMLQIPQRYALTAQQTSEMSDLAIVLAIVQPYLTDNAERLPVGALDSLTYRASQCSEAGYVAQELLRRNGHSVSTDCQTAERPLSAALPAPELSETAIPRVEIFPNPAENRVFINIGATDQPIRVTGYALDGKVRFDFETDRSVSFDCDSIPEGVYFVRIMLQNRIIGRTKLVISR